MDLCGVVILYYPDDRLVERINTYRKVLRQLIIIDNSERPNHQLLSHLIAEEGVSYLHDGSNKGMARRLNQAAALAASAGFQWLLTMDQDSFFENAGKEQYRNCLSAYENKEKVAMFGVEHDPRLHTPGNICASGKTTFLITSGSVLNLKLWPEIGDFDEALFIDHVDEDYCFRSLMRGYEIIKFSGILLRHSIGLSTEHRSIKTLQKTSRSLHSPVRLYYMTRNFLYLRKKHGKAFENEIRQFRKNLLNRYKNNLLYNKKRLLVFQYILKGLKDYGMNRMGKLR